MQQDGEDLSSSILLGANCMFLHGYVVVGFSMVSTCGRGHTVCPGLPRTCFHHQTCLVCQACARLGPAPALSVAVLLAGLQLRFAMRNQLCLGRRLDLGWGSLPREHVNNRNMLSGHCEPLAQLALLRGGAGRVVRTGGEGHACQAVQIWTLSGGQGEAIQEF